MLTLLVLLGMSGLVPADSPHPAEDVANGFVRAVASGEMGALAALATKEATAAPDWQLLRKSLEGYDCISIPSHRVSIEAASDTEMELLVTIDAMGVARGARRSPLRLPGRWRIHVLRTPEGWKFQSIVVEERVLARRLAAQTPLTAEVIEAAAKDADLDELLVHLSDELATPLHFTRGTTAVGDILQSLAHDYRLTNGEIAVLRMRAMNAIRAGQKGRACEYADEAVALAEASVIPDAEAMALMTAGTIAWQAGRLDAALERYAASSARMEGVDDPRPSMKALYMRGELLISRGAYRDVLVSSTAVSDAAERFAWTEGRCIAAFQQCGLYSQLHDYEQSRRRAEETLHCSERMGNEAFISMALNNLFIAQIESGGDRVVAKQLMQRLIDRAPADDASQTAVAASHIQLGSMLAEEKRYEEAVSELLTGLEVVRKMEIEKELEADTLHMLAEIRMRQGRGPEALRLAEEADAILRAFPTKVQLAHGDPSWAVRATLGTAQRAAGKLPEAIEALQSSIELIESRRAEAETDELTLSGFMRDKAQPYRELVSLFVEQGRLRDAVVVSERYRARALGTAMARGNVDQLPSLSDEDRKRYDALNTAISDLNRKVFASGHDSANVALREELAKSRLDRDSFLARLYAEKPNIRERSLDDPQTVIGHAKRLLPHTDEGLLSYSVHDNETFVFYLERSGEDLDVAVRRIPITRENLEKNVRLFVSRIEQRDLGYRRSSRELYDLLVAPFAPRIGSKRLLYIVPDGMLWRLPFQALLRPDGRHLVEAVALAYAPSLTLLRNERNDSGGRGMSGTLLAVADPVLARNAATVMRATHRGRELGPLPDARTEVRAIQRTYGNGSRVLIGAEATETAVKKLAASFRILHVATHGIIDDASPMYSALILAESGVDDGFLEAREMMDLDLGADLAILSACESAGGDVTPGEGIIGMSWALMVAGCRNTVVSQWKVESRSTAALMIAFHREANRRNVDYPSALRRAQIEIMHKDEFSHPYYWSPFVLVSTSQ